MLIYLWNFRDERSERDVFNKEHQERKERLTYTIKQEINDSGFKDVAERDPIKETKKCFQSCFAVVFRYGVGQYYLVIM